MNSLENLLNFLQSLRDVKIRYNLDCVRDAIMVIVPAPSKHYEIEFFADGHLEVQTFGPSSLVTSSTAEELLQLIIHDVNG